MKTEAEETRTVEAELAEIINTHSMIGLPKTFINQANQMILSFEINEGYINITDLAEALWHYYDERFKDFYAHDD